MELFQPGRQNLHKIDNIKTTCGVIWNYLNRTLTTSQLKSCDGVIRNKWQQYTTSSNILWKPVEPLKITNQNQPTTITTEFWSQTHLFHSKQMTIIHYKFQHQNNLWSHMKIQKSNLDNILWKPVEHLKITNQYQPTTITTEIYTYSPLKTLLNNIHPFHFLKKKKIKEKSFFPPRLHKLAGCCMICYYQHQTHQFWHLFKQGDHPKHLDCSPPIIYTNVLHQFNHY